MNYNLANAALYNNDSVNIDNNSNIKMSKPTTSQNKRNVTFKNRHDNIKQKIKKDMIENIDVYQDDEDRNEYLPKQNNYLSENMNNNSNNNNSNNNSNEPVQFNYKEQSNNVNNNGNSINIDPPATIENFSKLDSQYAKDYYKQFSEYKGSYQIPQSSQSNNSDLLKKLDNILYLLEEQQEEKTNLVTEELILYVFLGIFVIYVLDSFVKVGKYTR